MGHDYRARPHQYQVLKSGKRIILLGGGVGSGKTDVGSIWSLRKALAWPESLGLIAANTYSQLADSTLRNFYRKVETYGLRVQPSELPRTGRPFTLKVHNGRRWIEILCRSMDKFETLSGLEIGWYWLDEVWQTPRAAFDLVNARLRDSRCGQPQGLLTTTLDEPSSWLYDVFVDKKDEDLCEVIYARTTDNLKNLPPGYLDLLKRTYDSRLFARMVEAKWVSLSKGRVYHQFDRREHVRPLTLDPNLPLCWSHDFNINPMSSLAAQIKGREVRIVDEIVLETSSTPEVIAEFRARGYDRHPAGVVIYGDAAGRAGDTRSTISDYQLLRQAGFTVQKVPIANPSLRDRHNTVNTRLKNAGGQVGLFIDPGCKVLIKGFETTGYKPGSHLEAESFEQHITTALGYLVHREFPLRGRIKGFRY